MQKLETRDGALLCGDDLLKDVIDDKEILGLNISLPDTNPNHIYSRRFR